MLRDRDERGAALPGRGADLGRAWPVGRPGLGLALELPRAGAEVPLEGRRAVSEPADLRDRLGVALAPAGLLLDLAQLGDQGRGALVAGRPELREPGRDRAGLLHHVEQPGAAAPAYGEVDPEAREGDTVHGTGGAQVERTEAALEGPELVEPAADLGQCPVLVAGLGLLQGAHLAELEPQRDRVAPPEPGVGVRVPAGPQLGLGHEELGGASEVACAPRRRRPRRARWRAGRSGAAPGVARDPRRRRPARSAAAAARPCAASAGCPGGRSDARPTRPGCARRAHARRPARTRPARSSVSPSSWNKRASRTRSAAAARIASASGEEPRLAQRAGAVEHHRRVGPAGDGAGRLLEGRQGPGDATGQEVDVPQVVPGHRREPVVAGGLGELVERTRSCPAWEVGVLEVQHAAVEHDPAPGRAATRSAPG